MTDSVFSRVLVPTDFSAGSKKAWMLAQRMSVVAGAELILLHVVPASPLGEARLHDEEARAALRSAQAEHQLGIPRGDDDGDPLGPWPSVFHGPLHGSAVARFSEATAATAADLERWAESARGNGCKVRTLLRVGLPYREVVEAAKDEHADLVVLATHGRGEIHRLLVGSVADRVVRMAPCPVLTLKEADGMM